MRKWLEDWNRLNPILADGEIGEIINQLVTKTGDGQTPWRDLPYTPAPDSDSIVMTTDLTAAMAEKQDSATAATDTELGAETSARTAAVALKQDASTAATDAEVTAAVLASKMKPTETKTAAYTAADRDVVLADATTAAFTVTLPAAVANLQITVKKIDVSVNAVTVSPTSGTIDGAATDVISAQWAVRRYTSDGTNWFTV